MTVYNKVVINNQTLMDISSDTVTPNTLLTGVTAHDNTGAAIIGTYTPTSGETINNQDKTITPTETRQYITADTGYTGLGQVVVEPIDNYYIGSTINRNDSTDLIVSGTTVTAPNGYYATNASASVATGTAGTPTVTKSAVTNNSVIITPSVTNTTGYITGGTLNGATVSVTASELVNGTLTIDDDGTYDVTNYASADVAIDYINKLGSIIINNHCSFPITFMNSVYSNTNSPINSTTGHFQAGNQAVTKNSSLTVRVPLNCIVNFRS